MLVLVDGELLALVVRAIMWSGGMGWGGAGLHGDAVEEAAMAEAAIVSNTQSYPLKERKVLGVVLQAENSGLQKRRRPEWGSNSSTPLRSPNVSPGVGLQRPGAARAPELCGHAKRPRGPAPAWGSDAACAEPSMCAGGAGWFAQAPTTMIDPATHDLAPYEAAAASLVISDKAFRRLRWAVGQMSGHHRSQGGTTPQRLHVEPFAQAVPAVQLVELLREGWGGVLMTSAQARQLRDILASGSANEPRAVDPDVHYALCCRVVDWWNLPLSYRIQGTILDDGAMAAVEAYTIGRRLPPLPECKSLVAEMAEQSASVERQLAKCSQPVPWSWNATPGPPLRQLGLGEASAALEAAVHGRIGGIGPASEDGTEMPLSQGSDMEM